MTKHVADGFIGGYQAGRLTVNTQKHKGKMSQCAAKGAATAYFLSEHVLYFGFARQNGFRKVGETHWQSSSAFSPVPDAHLAMPSAAFTSRKVQQLRFVADPPPPQKTHGVESKLV